MATTESAIEALERLAELDRLIHEPARLSIVALLYVVKRADFVFLMRHTGLTSGNLSSHLSKLETAGYVEVEKEFVGKMPCTLVSLIDRGREAFRAYRRSILRALEDMPE